MCTYDLQVVSYLGSWRSDVIKMPAYNLIDILIAAHIGAAQNWSSASLEDSDSGSSGPKTKLKGNMLWKGERNDLLQRDRDKALSIESCDLFHSLWPDDLTAKRADGDKKLRRKKVN